MGSVLAELAPRHTALGPDWGGVEGSALLGLVPPSLMVCSRSPGSLGAQDLGLSPGLWPVSSGDRLGGQACLAAEFVPSRRVIRCPE